MPFQIKRNFLNITLFIIYRLFLVPLVFGFLASPLITQCYASCGPRHFRMWPAEPLVRYNCKFEIQFVTLQHHSCLNDPRLKKRLHTAGLHDFGTNHRILYFGIVGGGGWREKHETAHFTIIMIFVK
jgi:hypothetical protein